MYLGVNNHRWHGVRDDKDDPFDPLRGPLAGYLTDGEVKKCPTKVNFVKGKPWDWNFEDGCGGYGYNMTYIGSRIWQSYTEENHKITTKDFEVRSPAQTLMFVDTAMTELDDNNRAYYLEYSFAEPRHWVIDGIVDVDDSIWGTPSPSIHFRHRDRANIGWADGHIDSRQMAEFDKENAYHVKSADMMIGWFEPIDNTTFDLK